MSDEYDSLLIVSFGGPEQPADVMPFLENVTRGRNIPRERLLEVAEHYQHFGGVSPLNQQVRDLMSELKPALKSAGIDLPMYWGNRNWHPMLADTLSLMKQDNRKHGLALVLSAYSSYSGCRQYREDIERARETVGPDAPTFDKIRVFYNHPDFITANADLIGQSADAFEGQEFQLVFTAHSIPMSMAETSRYALQLLETGRLIAEQLGIRPERWDLVYQSRSGRPQDPWLEPDICDHLRQLAERDVRNVVVAPIGFLSDHIEVLFDLDEEARNICHELGISMRRAQSVGIHPKFVQMLVELIEERLGIISTRRAVGHFEASHDICPIDCCPAPQRPPARPALDSATPR
ncbi:MAG TPA: ferrochelatase [Planctomycetaceae bacterium]|nr:ferrochelatase [Planctomycetaceae bacterium]